MVTARSPCTTIEIEQVHKSTGFYFFEKNDLKQVIVIVVCERNTWVPGMPMGLDQPDLLGRLGYRSWRQFRAIHYWSRAL